MALRTFFECEGSRLGGTTAIVYNVFSKLICILVMAEGIDPTEKTPLIPDTGDDDDDDTDFSKYDIYGKSSRPRDNTTL